MIRPAVSSRTLTVIDLLELRRRDHVASRVESSVVPPLDPQSRLQFDVVDASPRPTAIDELCLVEAVDCLGERIVVGITLGSRLTGNPDSERSGAVSISPARPAWVVRGD